MTSTVDVPPVIDQAEIDQFWEQGYLLVKRVLDRDEASYYRDLILDLIPRDLRIPEHRHIASGRIKPMRTPDNHTFDTPELLPLFANEKLYAVATQLLQSHRLRGRHLHGDWKRITHMTSVEVTGEAGDFALLHHLMPHAASHNRRPTPRVAQFMRFLREDHVHGYGQTPAKQYNEFQLAAMSPLCRRLLGVDPW